MALGALGIGALISGGSALLQSIVGGVQAAKGAKGFKKTMASRPTLGAEYLKPYEDILAKYKQTYSGDMPGLGGRLDQITQTGARARGAAERGAISSSAYGAQVGDIYQKELDEIQKRYLENTEFKLSGVDKIAGATATLGEKQSEQWNINKFLPWQTEMNRFGEQKQAGIQNLFSGIQSGVSTAMDFMGTQYYKEALKGLQGNGDTDKFSAIPTDYKWS